MDDDDRPVHRPLGMDPDTFVRVLWILAGAFFLLAVVSFLGEVFGWWNDLGEVGTTVGTIAGLLVSMGAILYGAGERQVDTVHRDVHEVHEAVLGNGRKLDKLETLDDVQYELDRQTGVLEEIRDRM